MLAHQRCCFPQSFWAGRGWRSPPASSVRVELVALERIAADLKWLSRAKIKIPDEVFAARGVLVPYDRPEQFNADLEAETAKRIAELRRLEIDSCP